MGRPSHRGTWASHILGFLVGAATVSAAPVRLSLTFTYAAPSVREGGRKGRVDQVGITQPTTTKTNQGRGNVTSWHCHTRAADDEDTGIFRL